VTVQSPISLAAADAAPDAPIFDPNAFRLNEKQATIIATARNLGQTVFAGRAAAYDREAKFPTENYRDLHRAGLLGIAIPKEHGGLGADAMLGKVGIAAELTDFVSKGVEDKWNVHDAYLMVGLKFRLGK